VLETVKLARALALGCSRGSSSINLLLAPFAWPYLPLFLYNLSQLDCVAREKNMPLFIFLNIPNQGTLRISVVVELARDPSTRIRMIAQIAAKPDIGIHDELLLKSDIASVEVQEVNCLEKLSNSLPLDSATDDVFADDVNLDKVKRPPIDKELQELATSDLGQSEKIIETESARCDG